jgi:DNA-binding NarL/FixJ family response regulator
VRHQLGFKHPNVLWQSHSPRSVAVQGTPRSISTTPRRSSRSFTRCETAEGVRLGRQPGHRPKSNRLVPKVMALVAKGRSYRLIGREVGLSKNTVADIVRRHRAVRTQAT